VSEQILKLTAHIAQLIFIVIYLHRRVVRCIIFYVVFARGHDDMRQSVFIKKSSAKTAIALLKDSFELYVSS